MFFPVYLAALAGAWALHSAQANGRMERIGFRLLAWALIVATVGDVLAYWGGSDPKEFAPIQEAGFGFELLSLVAMTVGILLCGLAARKSELFPGWAGWLMILAAPASVVVSTLVIMYVPHGWVLPISVALGIEGILVQRPKGNGRTRPSALARRLR